MNRRNAIRAAIGGLIAAVMPAKRPITIRFSTAKWVRLSSGTSVPKMSNPIDWPNKRPDIVAMTPEGVEPPDDFDCGVDPVYLTFSGKAYAEFSAIELPVIQHSVAGEFRCRDASKIRWA